MTTMRALSHFGPNHDSGHILTIKLWTAADHDLDNPLKGCQNASSISEEARLPMQILISHYSFSVSAPYSEGHSLSALEAQALNAIRAENIRNLAFKAFKKAGLLASIQSPTSLEQMARDVSRIDHSYEFRPPSTPKRESPLDLLLREIALEIIQQRERQQGYPLSDSDFDSTLQTLICAPEVQSEARRRLEARQVIAQQSLEEIFDLLP